MSAALRRSLIGLAVAAAVAIGTPPAAAQSGSATLSGTVVDQSGAVLTDVKVSAVNSGTNVQRDAVTDASGTFTLTTLQPGRYILRADHPGFTPTEVPDLTLSVGDRLVVRIQLKIAVNSESVSVVAEASRVRTSPALSTVVDRQFVENLPLSGRSLQSLLELTPGVTLFKANSNPLGGGQFSVNGQRTNANYFMVDGVSANTAISTGAGSFAGHSASGALPGLTALGSTQSLVSIDALQEFRVQTSTYAPEFGRSPGAQISMLTRSGTNSFHGSLSEYFRDDAFDASDWFANRQGLAKPKLRQHDFGGTLGGPILRNQTFFFASYEGLRLDLPTVKTVAVPTVELRESVPAEMGTLLRMYPLPNANPVSDGLANFVASYSDPSQLDTSAVRLDHQLSSRMTLFGRYSHAPSQNAARMGSLNHLSRVRNENDSITTGWTWILGNTMTHDLRVNWTYTRGIATRELSDFGGAILPPESLLFMPGLTPQNSFVSISMTGTESVTWGTGNDNYQRQFNLVDSLAWVTGAHQLKAGIDWRRVSPILGRAGGDFMSYAIGPIANARANTLNLVQLARGADESHALYTNFSAYVQDTWTMTPRLTLTYGLRWELNPPPSSPNDHLPLTLEDPAAPSPIRLLPKNTPLYETTYNNFAPRIGAAYQLSQTAGRELMLRGGFGMFHDTGFGVSSIAFDHIYPFFASKVVNNVTLPLSGEALIPPIVGEQAAQQLWIMDRHTKMPYSYQWNVSVEQTLGQRQSLTVSYVGSAGRRQLRRESYSLLFEEFGAARVPVSYSTNGATSDYKALQVQFQHRLSNGLQALLNYTLSESNDTVSDDSGFLGSGVPGVFTDLSREYGPSDFDVRHVFSGGVTYDVPTIGGSRVLRAALGGWGLDGLVRLRSAFPLTPQINVVFPPPLSTLNVRPNVVPGVPVMLEGPQYAGGKAINPAAFTAPTPGTVGESPRNAIRGFGAHQVDLTLRRQVPLPRALRLQFRFDLFNVFNHPNFADPSVNLSTSNFGVSTTMLNRGLGSLNALYQIGGPRSAQVSVKLLF